MPKRKKSLKAEAKKKAIIDAILITCTIIACVENILNIIAFFIRS